MNITQMIKADAPAVAAAAGALTSKPAERMAIAMAAVHNAVEACISATGQRRTISLFVNQIELANDVVHAFEGAGKTGGA